MRIAVLGLGEAGRIFARDLAQNGASVTAFDVRDVGAVPGVSTRTSVADAVSGAELILSLTTAGGALEAAEASADAMPAKAVFADLNAGSPDLMERAAVVIGPERFVDVAVLTPATRFGVRSHLLASGEAAPTFSSYFTDLGAPVRIVPGPAGAASRWKLMRSIFMKAMAAAILESLSAARVADCEEWLLAQIAGELGENGVSLVDRLITGTHEHAARRVAEMEDARDCLAALATPTEVTDAAIIWLRAVAAGDRV